MLPVSTDKFSFATVADGPSWISEPPAVPGRVRGAAFAYSQEPRRVGLSLVASVVV